VIGNPLYYHTLEGKKERMRKKGGKKVPFNYRMPKKRSLDWKEKGKCTRNTNNIPARVCLELSKAMASSVTKTKPK
jgi:hypothetical protein